MKYFIDYENVFSGGLVGIETLDANDELIIFHNERSSVPMSMLRALEVAECRKEYIQVATKTKNALDFQLASYLGSFVNKEKEFYIVSKDQGYDAVTAFWKTRNVIVTRCNNVKKETNQVIENVFREALDDEPEIDVKEMVKIANQYKTKQGVNNALVKKYGRTKGGQIYRKIKPFIGEKK